MVTIAAQMPVRALARIVGEHDTRLWRVVKHYVDEARLWLWNPERLTPEQRDRLDGLLDPSRIALDTAEAYRLKLAFQEFRDLPPELARLHVEPWCLHAGRCPRNSWRFPEGRRNRGGSRGPDPRL